MNRRFEGGRVYFNIDKKRGNRLVLKGAFEHPEIARQLSGALKLWQSQNCRQDKPVQITLGWYGPAEGMFKGVMFTPCLKSSLAIEALKLQVVNDRIDRDLADYRSGAKQLAAVDKPLAKFDFNRAFNSALEAKGYSKNMLAKQLGVSAQSLSPLKRGADCTLGRAELIANILQYNLAEFVALGMAEGGQDALN